jgi:Orsellinic acid/F9775 biosynthesis cluster protein D
MDEPIPIQFQCILRYEHKYRVLICLHCQMALGKRCISRHLREHHSAVPKKQRKILTSALVPLSIVEPADGLPLPPDLSDLIRGLAILDAKKCNGCDFITKSIDLIQRHVRQKHPDYRPSILDPNVYWNLVKAQRWGPTGKGAKYWTARVAPDVATSSSEWLDSGEKN